MSVYKPLFVYLEPASIPQVVAHIQKYLAENPIVSDPESIAEAIRDYIEEHPEIIAVASVNGKTGNVVLTGSDININASSAVSVETQLLNLASMISTAGADIEQINAQLETIYTNIGTIETNVSNNTSAISALQTSVEGQGTRLATAETDIDNLETAQTAQGTRLNSAEGNISSLQTRMTQAETDIDNSETAINTNTESITNIRSIISQIQSDITDLNTYSRSAIENPNYTLTNGNIAKRGNMVTVSLRFNKAAGGSDTIGTIPAGYRPPFDITIRTPCNETSGCPIIFRSTGEIITTTQQTGDIRCSVAYVTSDEV